tara:strand:+ start:199 stop:804 length:606 start_codon:yes stop_codon:yes gene_type:complete
MLLAQNITLTRSNRKIFEDINISLASGKIVILKGKNGSGKTSLLKTIVNILQPTSGSIYWKGKPLYKTLYDFYDNITYIADKTSSLRQLSTYENIRIWKNFFLSKVSYQQIDNILEVLNLNKYTRAKVGNLSLGEIKKLELVRLIIENKKIWILDEPLTNLDDESINVIEQTFVDHCSNGGSILFSSHQKPTIKLTEEIVL